MSARLPRPRNEPHSWIFDFDAIFTVTATDLITGRFASTKFRTGARPTNRRARIQMNKLAQYVNRSVLVGSDALFEGAELRRCTLVAVDEGGVWLESDEWPGKLTESSGKPLVSHMLLVFVPYARIECIVPGGNSIRSTEHALLVATQRNAPETRVNPQSKGPAASRSRGRTKKN
jgi:hypothetical protein